MDAQSPSPEPDAAPNAAPSARQAVGLQRGRLAAVALTAVGGIVLLVGWIGTASAVHPAQQLPYIISGGLGGLALVGLGAALWLSSDLADEWTKLDLIESALSRLVDAEGTEVAVAVPTESVTTPTNGRTIRRREPVRADAES